MGCGKCKMDAVCRLRLVKFAGDGKMQPKLFTFLRTIMVGVTYLSYIFRLH